MKNMPIVCAFFLAAIAASAGTLDIPDDPFAFAELGATFADDGTITFALHAPEKKSVSVIGDFNKWNPDALPMTQDAKGTWIATTRLKPGTYTYQYLVDGKTRIADPYAGDVKWQDGEGNETWRPERCFTVLEVGAKPYEWAATNYVRPSLDNLVVYEFHLDDFLGGSGTFTGLIDRLDYIKDLGFTAIEPLPVMEFTGGHSWGYNPSFHFAPESAYGTPTELKQLIDAAHKRGLAVIADLVLNHMDWNSALFQLYGEDYDASPYFQKVDGDNWGFPDLEQTNRVVRRYASDVIQHWTTDYRFDGIRYDATRFTGWHGYNDWGASWFAFIGRRTDLTSFQIAEHMPSDPELIKQTDMDTTWHDYFRWRLRDMLENGYVEKTDMENLLDPLRIGFTNALQRMNYTESHDEERVMYSLKQHGYAADEKIRRCISALAITLTSPGPVMIYSGQEFGESTRKVVGSNPLQWQLLETESGAAIYDATRKLVHLRTTSPALRYGGIAFLHNGQPDGMTAYQRDFDEDSVIVAANFGRGANTMDLHFTGTWSNLLSGAVFVENGEDTRPIALQPGETAVFVKQSATVK